jgi:hypothetical protein
MPHWTGGESLHKGELANSEPIAKVGWAARSELLNSGCSGATMPSQMRKCFEYAQAFHKVDHGRKTFVDLPDGTRREDLPAEPTVALSVLGAEGWELVSVTAQHAPTFFSLSFWLRRELDPVGERRR